jgi:hypothetical protein
MNERKYSDYLREECNFVTNVKLKTSNVIIIIIIIGSIPRRAFQYLFTNYTFDRLINVYKNNYKRNL